MIVDKDTIICCSRYVINIQFTADSVSTDNKSSDKRFIKVIVESVRIVDDFKDFPIFFGYRQSKGVGAVLLKRVIYNQ